MDRAKVPQGQYFSPCAQLRRFRGLSEKHGPDVYTKGKYKAEREAWIAALFLLGYIHRTGQDWWLRQPEQDPPDAIAVAYHAEESRVELLNIEIFEYESHAPLGLADAVGRKLAGKKYPSDYRLVCYVRDREGEPFTIAKEAERVAALNPEVSEVWVVASIEDPDPTKHVIAQLYPQPLGYAVGYSSECAETKQPDMIDLTRGKDDGTTSFGWREVPLP